MKQSNRNNNDNKIAAIYARISRDDDLDSESNSVTIQKQLLTKFAKDKGYTNLRVYCDDGISGMTVKRPDFQKMLSAVKKGEISAVFVKDFSRLTREEVLLLQLGREVFPEYGVFFYSYGNSSEPISPDDPILSMYGMVNEQMVRDISRKCTISAEVRGNSGIPLGPPPYGYIKNPDIKGHWMVDEEAAAHVRRIFELNLSGYGTEQIAAMLEKDKILTPTHYQRQKGIKRGGKKSARGSCEWNSSSVVKILTAQEYCGDVINFKTKKPHGYSKRRIKNPPEAQVIFIDVHEPIIDRATFEKVQQKRGKVRKRKTKTEGERNMFCGLLVCADCGGNMNFHYNQKNPDIHYFNCSNNNSTRKTCDKTHYIRVDFLEQVILGEIHRLTKFAKQYENEFAELIMGHSLKNSDDERNRKKKELYAKNAKIREYDNKIDDLYGYKVSGTISEERFVRMMNDFDEKQNLLIEEVRLLEAELEKATESAVTLEDFMKTVRKYTRTKKLTPQMLSELIEYIEVYHAEKVDGKKVQRLRIHYHCVGDITIPDLKRLGAPEVEMNTRKGVDIAYSA